MDILQELISPDSPRKPVMTWLADNLPSQPNIVEVGAARDWTSKSYRTDGLLSLHLLNMIQGGKGELWSVDVDPYTIFALNSIFLNASLHSESFAHAILQDGVEFLEEFDELIDVLILDANDVWTDNYKEAHLAMYQAARSKLAKDAILILDDCYCIDNLGKGELVLPLAIEDGFKYEIAGYTMVLRRHA